MMKCKETDTIRLDEVKYRQGCGTDNSNPKMEEPAFPVLLCHPSCLVNSIFEARSLKWFSKRRCYCKKQQIALLL
uniref:Uncharacterized protein n=1 Tax=Anguilla anguilla TaxID=7936 RepID=A0A0E9SS13_ANGAN